MEDCTKLCSVCGKKVTATICICTSVVTLLCDTCCEISKTSQHFTYPVTLLPDFEKPGFMEKLQARTIAFGEVKELTRKRIEVVDQGIAEINATIEEWVKYCRDTIDNLEELKSQIKTSLTEVERTIMEEQPDLKMPYSQIIRSFVESNSVNPWLVEISCNLANPESFIIVKNQANTQYGISDFPYLHGNTLHLYDLCSSKTSTISLSTCFTAGTVFCLLTDHTVLCLGGYPPSSSVCKLDLSSKQLATLPGTKTPRSYPGIAKVGDYAYVFGSFSPLLATCEKLSLSDEVWAHLGDMNTARCCFTPGVHLKEIYLVGPYGGNRSIQVFDTQNDTFRTLSFQLPASIASYTTAFAVAGELYVLGGYLLGKWVINSGKEMQVSATTGRSAPLSNCPAFLVDNEVLLVNYSRGALFKLNFMTKTVVS